MPTKKANKQQQKKDLQNAQGGNPELYVFLVYG